jgi:hypothetical protein
MTDRFRLFVDGGATISISAFLATLINGYLPFQDFQGPSGAALLASIILTPTVWLVYGVTRMFFAAYEAHKKKVEQRVRKEERARIQEALDRVRREHGAPEELAWDDILNVVRESPEK